MQSQLRGLKSIAADLGKRDLLQKHFPGWMRKTITKDQVRNMVLSSKPQDFDYNDGTGGLVHTGNVKLRIILDSAMSRSTNPGSQSSPILRPRRCLSRSITARRRLMNCNAFMFAANGSSFRAGRAGHASRFRFLDIMSAVLRTIT